MILPDFGEWTATIIANLAGGLIFYWVDMFIFTSSSLAVYWEIRDGVRCVDCGKDAQKGFRVIKAGKSYDKTFDDNPEFRCQDCSSKKIKELRGKGVRV
jgi:DNA-directed RNA polymerase subunit RPC12/RpoP